MSVIQTRTTAMATRHAIIMKGRLLACATMVSLEMERLAQVCYSVYTNSLLSLEYVGDCNKDFVKIKKKILITM